MAKSRQILVRGLDGRTLCIPFETLEGDSERVSGGCVAALVSARTGIPSNCLRLVTGTGVVSDVSLLTADVNDGSFPSCSLLLRLPGGKGGFGSLLRGAATKAGQKKTSNFDACRDMSGRRLRHVNAEKKLKEWKADAEERELEKTAEEFLKKATKAKEEDNGVFEELEKFRAETSRGMEEVEQAVASGLVEARKSNFSSKRKVQEEAAMLDKRARLWMGDEDDDDDSDDESMDEDERPSSSGEPGPSSSGEPGPSSSGEPGPSSSGEPGPSSSGDADVAVTTPEQVESSLGPSITSSQVKVVKTVVTEIEVENTVSGTHSSEKVTVTTETLMTISTATTDTKEEISSRVTTDATDGGNPDASIIEVVPALCVANGQSSENDTAIPESYVVVEVNGSGKDAERISKGGDRTETSTGSHVLKGNKGSEVVQAEPLDISKYQSAEELQALGLEKLKMELQSRGLKCGGSLSERVGRLFLLKTIPLEKLEKKHFSGNAKGAKK